MITKNTSMFLNWQLALTTVSLGDTMHLTDFVSRLLGYFTNAFVAQVRAIDETVTYLLVRYIKRMCEAPVNEYGWRWWVIGK